MDCMTDSRGPTGIVLLSMYWPLPPCVYHTSQHSSQVLHLVATRINECIVSLASREFQEDIKDSITFWRSIALQRNRMRCYRSLVGVALLL